MQFFVQYKLDVILKANLDKRNFLIFITSKTILKKSFHVKMFKMCNIVIEKNHFLIALKSNSK